MTRRIAHQQLVDSAQIVAPPLAAVEPRACTDRSFELPVILHFASVALFLGFVGVLCVAFRNPELAIPSAVFAAFIVAFFAVPGLWARMKPEDSRTSALGWNEFRELGIATATGRTGAVEATTLVLIMPVVLLAWSTAIAIIAATVR